MGMALTGKVVPYKKGFGVMPGDVFHVPFPVEMYGVRVADSIVALEKLFKTDVDPENGRRDSAGACPGRRWFF